MLDPIQPLLTSEALRLKKKGNPCSDYCFIYLDLLNDSDVVGVQIFESLFGVYMTRFVLQEDVRWENAADFETLEGILQLAPDSLPCDLAVIMHVKCQDVRFTHRTALRANLFSRSLYIAGAFSLIEQLMKLLSSKETTT